MTLFIRLVAPALLAFPLLASPARAEIDIQPVTTPGGIEAWLVEERSIPFVAIEVVFAGGAALEAAESAGATALMATLLGEGSGDMDAQAMAEATESLAAGISFSSGRDSVTLSIRALSENRDQVIDLARLALMEPRFDADAFERERARALSGLQRDARNPNAIAARRFAETAFAGHPYALPVSGTPDSVAALAEDDLATAHRAAIARDRIHVGVAGDISAAELAPLLDRLLGDLPETGAPLPERVEFAAPPGVQVIDFPGPQSLIFFGHAGIPRDDPDFLTAFVVNDLFGSGRFGTRLMRELRERRGLTYGVGTGLSAMALGEAFQGRVSTDNANAGTVVELLRAEWEWLAGGGISQADLDAAQTYLTGSYPLRFNGNEAIAGILASMQVQGFPIDYVNVRNDMVAALTLEDVHRVAARLAQPDALHFVVVGRPEGLEDAGL